MGQGAADAPARADANLSLHHVQPDMSTSNMDWTPQKVKQPENTARREIASVPPSRGAGGMIPPGRRSNGGSRHAQKTIFASRPGNAPGQIKLPPGGIPKGSALWPPEQYGLDPAKGQAARKHSQTGNRLRPPIQGGRGDDPPRPPEQRWFPSRSKNNFRLSTGQRTRSNQTSSRWDSKGLSPLAAGGILLFSFLSSLAITRAAWQRCRRRLSRRTATCRRRSAPCGRSRSWRWRPCRPRTGPGRFPGCF